MNEVTVKVSVDRQGTIRIRKGDMYILESPFHMFDTTMATVFDSIFSFDVQLYIDRQKEEDESKMKFEIGKYYEHTSGEMMSIVGELTTTMFGTSLVAESTKTSNLVPVGRDAGSAENWAESTQEEWEKNFSK